LERTLAIIKPDAVRNGHAGEIISRIEQSALRIETIWKGKLPEEFYEEFYAEHRGKPFYDDLIVFMAEGPVVVMILEGLDAPERWRALLGATNPAKAESGTIRGDFGNKEIMHENAGHGSADHEAAGREIPLFALFQLGLRAFD
jgi:nucleoside-diphosphate kinase